MNYTIEGLKTKFIGKRIDYYIELESTHLLAKETKDALDGTIIWTDHQTNGIGTHQNKWFSQASRNLTFDIILTPNCNVNKIANLTSIIPNCIVETLKSLYKIETSIKEPNDIYINDKKMGGILTESKCRGEIVEKIFIGIGLNINQQEFPKEIENIATSLKKEFNREFSREMILKRFLEIFEKEYLKMLNI